MLHQEKNTQESGEDLHSSPFQGAPSQEAFPCLLSQVEAVLFLSRDPIPGRRLAQLAEIPEGTRIRSLIQRLNSQYDAQSRAFRVFEVGGGFQLRTLASFVPWLARLHHESIEIRLSNSAMETLAIVAYQQPVLRATIEKIRGVQCGELLRQLMEQDLVKIVGKSNDPGRPFLYGTTRKFLQIFGLNRIEELL